MLSKLSWWCAGVVLASALSIPRAHAQRELTILPLKPKQIRVDGDLGDWRGAKFGKVGQPGESIRYALGYDNDALYVAARVQDASFIRSAKPSPKEDAVVLTFVAPQTNPSDRFVVSELWLFAGIPGEQAAVSLLATAHGKPKPAKVQLVEGPLEGPGEEDPGYVIEARIPWGEIPNSSSLPLGRGAIRAHDVDEQLGAEPLELATAGPPFDRMPELLFDGGPTMALRAFLADKGFPSDSAQLELFDDVMGDPRIERVLVQGTYVIVASAQLAGGFRYLDLPVTMASEVKGMELTDLSGDGKAEIVVAMRDRSGADVRKAYTWNGQKLDVYVDPSSAPAPAPQPARTTLRSARPAPVQDEEVVLEHPKPPGMEQLVSAYREARGIDPTVKPRFLTHVNLAEDKAIESVMLFGKELLVVGRGYRGGTGFFFFGLPVIEGSQIQRMFTADVTGDGRREVFIRFKQIIGDVQREILLGYTLNDEGMQPILATEVRRAQGDKSVGNIVKVVRAGKAYAIRVSPGVANGYTATSYPFVTEATDSYGPLLLPWKDRDVQYAYDGQSLQPQ